jgi:hypothetical protein
MQKTAFAPALSILFCYEGVMELVQATLWIYANAIRRSFECVTENWIISFAPLAYGFALSLAGLVVAPLGLVGGLLLGLATQACFSSGLYLLENMVKIGKANFNDFIRGFTVYLWELLLIAFILWIPMRVAATALASVPNGALIYLLIRIALYVLLNPLPECLYQTRSSGIELLSASYNFIVENWIEWFLPNIILTVAGFFVFQTLEIFSYGLPGFVQLFVLAFGFGLCLTYFMVFRGFLFAELNGTTRRSRVYRYNARSGHK